MNKSGIMYYNINVRSCIDVCIHVIRGTIIATTDSKDTDFSSSEFISATNNVIEATTANIKL